MPVILTTWLAGYRVRLANARVSVNLSQSPDTEEVQRDVIPLLCSIFLASQSTGETAEAISPVILSNPHVFIFYNITKRGNGHLPTCFKIEISTPGGWQF
jgi:hypothetical protein